MMKNNIFGLMVYFLFALLIFAKQGFASPPTVSSVTGNVINGQDINIYGTNFGTHLNYDTGNNGRLNWAWTNFASATLTSSTLTVADGFSASAEGYIPNLTKYYLLTTSGARVSGKQYLKTYNDGTGSLGSNDRNTNGTMKSTDTFPSGEIFYSFWIKGPTNFQGGKMFRMYDPDYFLATPSADWFLATGGTGQTLRAVAYDQIVWNGPNVVADGTWKRIDGYFKPSPSPHQQAWIVGANSNNTQFDVNFTTHVWSSGKLDVDITPCIVYGGNSDTNYYAYDDVYIDFTQARVEICDTSTWAARSHCEIQIPKTWASSLSARVNQGSFANNSSAYLYVVNSNGEASNGQLITFGSSGGNIVNGSCGSSNGQSLSSAPTTNLCSQGTASSVSGSGPWTWTCSGSNGGTTASCSASLTSTPTSITRSECSNPPSGTVFCEDFEGANPKANFNDYDGNTDTENQVITNSAPSGDSSNKLIQLQVANGQVGSDLLKVLPGSYDKLYARWYFKYQPGFDFTAGNHGSGLAAGDRNYVGQSGIRPTGADFAGFFMQYHINDAKPYAYSYYRGMYQDCADPNGSCWGDSLPCVYDDGSNGYCTKPADRPTIAMPTLVAGQWYCYEQMVDMGTASTNGTGATGRVTQWLDGNLIGDNTNLWLRTTSGLKLQNLWLNLYFGTTTHPTVAELIDNVIVSTQRIGCGGGGTSTPVSNVRPIQVIP